MAKFKNLWQFPSIWRNFESTLAEKMLLGKKFGRKCPKISSNLVTLASLLDWCMYTHHRSLHQK